MSRKAKRPVIVDGLPMLYCPELYRDEEGNPPPEPGDTALLNLRECKELEASVINAMGDGRLDARDGDRELATLRAMVQHLSGLKPHSPGKAPAVAAKIGTPVIRVKTRAEVRAERREIRARRKRERKARKAGRRRR